MFDNKIRKSKMLLFILSLILGKRSKELKKMLFHLHKKFYDYWFYYGKNLIFRYGMRHLNFSDMYNFYIKTSMTFGYIEYFGKESLGRHYYYNKII